MSTKSLDTVVGLGNELVNTFNTRNIVFWILKRMGPCNQYGSHNVMLKHTIAVVCAATVELKSEGELRNPKGLQ